jgi:hypothetical protein
MSTIGPSSKTSLNQLHDIKRTLIKQGAVDGETPKRNAEFLDILDDLHFLLRDLGPKALRMHNQVESTIDSPLRATRDRGLRVYESIRKKAVPFHSPDQIDPSFLGSHRTILFWELMRFFALAGNSPQIPVRDLYFNEYIAPVMTYYAEVLRNSESSRERITNAWREKIGALEVAGAKGRYLEVNRFLLNEYIEDVISNNAALVLSLPYLVRVFIPTQDRLEDWVVKGERTPPAEEIRTFYLAVQHALVVEAMKRQTKKKIWT